MVCTSDPNTCTIQCRAVNTTGSHDLTGASLNIKIISSISNKTNYLNCIAVESINLPDGPRDQFLLTGWPTSLTRLVGTAKLCYYEIMD